MSVSRQFQIVIYTTVQSTCRLSNGNKVVFYYHIPGEGISCDLDLYANEMVKLSTLALVVANALIPIAILTFASGFFPYKPFLSGLAEYEALEFGSIPEAPFDKVIFMVVDALRR